MLEEGATALEDDAGATCDGGCGRSSSDEFLFAERKPRLQAIVGSEANPAGALLGLFV